MQKFLARRRSAAFRTLLATARRNRTMVRSTFLPDFLLNSTEAR